MGESVAEQEIDPKDVGTVGGGRTTRGPNEDPGGENDLGVEVPPYADRLSGPSDDKANRAESVGRQLSGQDAPQDTVQPTGNLEGPAPEMAPSGVGESHTQRGEDVADSEGQESGRVDTGTQGSSGRPTGTSGPEDATGVDPQDSGSGG